MKKFTVTPLRVVVVYVLALCLVYLVTQYHLWVYDYMLIPAADEIYSRGFLSNPHYLTVLYLKNFSGWLTFAGIFAGVITTYVLFEWGKRR